MKIGIVGGLEQTLLFKFLNKFNCEYFFYFDQNGWPLGDKSLDFSIDRIKKAIDILFNDFGVNKIILNPLFELYFRYELKYENILTLSEKYFLEGLNKSLVGKIGFVGDFLDKRYFQELFKRYILPKYNLNDNQKNIKKFNSNFPVWIKETVMWKYYLIQFSFRDRMVRKTIKTDLRYFKDADVDTLFILNWGYLAYDNLLRRYLDYKRIRYHGLDLLENIFKNILDIESEYKVNIIVDGHIDFLLRQKKLVWLLQRGKQIQLNIYNLT